MSAGDGRRGWREFGADGVGLGTEDKKPSGGRGSRAAGGEAERRDGPTVVEDTGGVGRFRRRRKVPWAVEGAGGGGGSCRGRRKVPRAAAAEGAGGDVEGAESGGEGTEGGVEGAKGGTEGT